MTREEIAQRTRYKLNLAPFATADERLAIVWDALIDAEVRAESSALREKELREALRGLVEVVEGNWQCTPDANCADCEIIQPKISRARAVLSEEVIRAANVDARR
jgi:hypothetical protein